MMRTVPASLTPATASDSVPTARSSNPSASKSPVARPPPNSSPVCARPLIPGLAADHDCVNVVPGAGPYRTTTDPAPSSAPTVSPGIEMARSATPSPLKSEWTDGAAGRPVSATAAGAGVAPSPTTNAIAAIQVVRTITVRIDHPPGPPTCDGAAYRGRAR